MATGAGLNSIVSAILPLVGLVTVWFARRKRLKGGETPEDAELARRRGERAQMERRMAAYLAQRGSAAPYAQDDDPIEQEIRR
jgi:hypothetical protein